MRKIIGVLLLLCIIFCLPACGNSLKYLTEDGVSIQESPEYGYSSPATYHTTPKNGETAILGTWTKDTGVSYTFESDGHMSVSMSSYYNPSAGTSLDGIEVNSLLSEIEDWGRIVRGGTWHYEGEVQSDSGLLYQYGLFYDGSQWTCLIRAETGTPLGIALDSGIGDMSLLYR